MFNKALKIWEEEGSASLARRAIRFGYDTYVRSLLPKRIVFYNDIPVYASRFGDSIIPWQTEDIPGYEDALLQGITQYVENGDKVVVVGGGWGVSTVSAAEQAGESGQIITYEGGEETVEQVEDTVWLNRVNDRVSVRHAIVGRNVSLRGDGTRAAAVPPMELPDCDVLVLDCEGAEIGILDEMNIRPRNIIVETHGVYGATKADVHNKLARAGYETVESMVAEEQLREACEKNGIFVLFATIRN